jgi:hypothetical protein
MGLGGSRVAPSSMKYLVKKLSEAYLPDDRNIVANTLEQMDTLLLLDKYKKVFDTHTQVLKETNAMYIIIKIAKKLADGKLYHSSTFAASLIDMKSRCRYSNYILIH